MTSIQRWPLHVLTFHGGGGGGGAGEGPLYQDCHCGGVKKKATAIRFGKKNTLN